jgi:hypothetical protein
MNHWLLRAVCNEYPNGNSGSNEGLSGREDGVFVLDMGRQLAIVFFQASPAFPKCFICNIAQPISVYQL